VRQRREEGGSGRVSLADRARASQREVAKEKEGRYQPPVSYPGNQGTSEAKKEREQFRTDRKERDGRALLLSPRTEKNHSPNKSPAIAAARMTPQTNQVTLPSRTKVSSQVASQTCLSYRSLCRFHVPPLRLPGKKEGRKKFALTSPRPQQSHLPRSPHADDPRLSLPS